MTFKHLSAAVALAGSVVACNQSQPVAPSPIPPPVLPVSTYTLSGDVTEATPAGLVPVSGVLVKESTTSRRAVTDAEGHYSITNVPATSASTTISASKSNYTPRSVTRTINGDTRVDLQLDRRPGFTLSGVISEMMPTGLTGISGVEIVFFSYVANDNYGEGAVDTDEQGRYRLTGVWAGPDVYTGIWLRKDGYRIDPQLSPSCDGCFRTLTITGDTVLDIQLERLQKPASDLSLAAYNPVFRTADHFDGRVTPGSLR